jgi:hypothetical protein
MVGGSPDNYQGAPRYDRAFCFFTIDIYQGAPRYKKALRENEGPFVFSGQHHRKMALII